MSTATPGEHLSRSEAHRGFSETVDEASHHESPGWKVTALFYAAVRAIDCHLAKKGEFPTNHLERASRIRSDKTAMRIWTDYRRLKDRSEASRYGAGGLTPKDVTDARAALNTIKGTLGV